MKFSNELACELSISNFQVEANGIHVALPSKNLEPKTIHLCNFIFHFSGRIFRHLPNGEITEEVEISIVGKNETISVSIHKFDKIVSEITKNFPECCVTGEARSCGKAYLREYAALLYERDKTTLPVRNFFHCHGWFHDNGRWRYISNSDENCECAVTIPKVEPKKIPEIFKTGQLMLKVASPEIFLPFFLYIHLGFAAKLFEDAGLSAQFLLLLVGKTGSLKTTFCKTFAIPFNSEAIIRIESTPRALELCRESSMDMIMVADDIFRTIARLMAKLEDLLRPYGDGIGRAKSYKAATKILKTRVRGGCIVTAESSLNQQQSSVFRTVTVMTDKTKVNLEILQKFQDDQEKAKRENRPNDVQKYFAAWIQYLEENFEKIIEKIIAAGCITIKTQAKIKQFPLRYQKICKIFLILADLILEWGTELGVISTENYENLYKDWQSIILNLLEKNAAAAIKMEAWQKFLVNLQAGIATGEFLIAKNRNEYETGEGKFIGFVEEKNSETEKFILSPTAVWSALAKYTRQKNFLENRTAILKELSKRNVIEGYTLKGANGKTRQRYLKKFTLNKLSTEMLVIKKAEMEQAVEEIQNAI